jgi:hypothetical protein
VTASATRNPNISAAAYGIRPFRMSVFTGRTAKGEEAFNSTTGLEHYDGRSRIFRVPGFAAWLIATMPSFRE